MHGCDQWLVNISWTGAPRTRTLTYSTFDPKEHRGHAPGDPEPQLGGRTGVRSSASHKLAKAFRAYENDAEEPVRMTGPEF